MKRFVFIIINCGLLNFVTAQQSAQSIVEQFYKCCNTVIEGSFVEAQRAIEEVKQFVPDEDMSLPNEFMFMGLENDADDFYRVSNYMQTLEKFSRAKKIVKFDYAVMGITFFEKSNKEADFKGYAKKAIEVGKFASIKTIKVITLDGSKTYRFNDSLIVDTKTGKIVRFYNEVNPPDDYASQSESNLLSLAQYYYQKKQCADAYKVYKYLAETRKSFWGYYRLAAMTYAKEGVIIKPSKTRIQETISLLKAASKNANDYKLRNRAEFIIRWLEEDKF